MKALKRAGIAVAIIAMVCALGVVGRMETEDRQYVCGEITREQMTPDADLYKLFGVIGGTALVGGVMWITGAYHEADRAEKRYARYYR